MLKNLRESKLKAGKPRCLDEKTRAEPESLGLAGPPASAASNEARPVTMAWQAGSVAEADTLPWLLTKVLCIGNTSSNSRSKGQSGGENSKTGCP